MRAPRTVPSTNVDPVIAAFENARPLDEPLSPAEICALEEAMADPEPGISTEELLVRLRQKP